MPPIARGMISKPIRPIGLVPHSCTQEQFVQQLNDSFLGLLYLLIVFHLFLSFFMFCAFIIKMMPKKISVVEFLPEKTVEAVPSSWVEETINVSTLVPGKHL